MTGFVTPSLLVPALRNDLNLRALESLIARFADLDVGATVIYDFDTVDASALTSLAEQFGVLGDAGWDIANTDAKKRALLKEAVALHRIKGTPYAVKRALALLDVNATLTEWFDMVPRGTPHTFNLYAQVTDQDPGAPAIDDARAQQIRRVVSYWKPVRSHFDLSVGIGMSSDWSMASIFSNTQLLDTVGDMLGLDISSTLDLQSVHVFSGSQLLGSSGSIQL